LPPPKEKRTRAIDWQAIYRRIETGHRELERGATPTAAEKKEVFRKRAQKLAGEPAVEEADRGSIEVIQFLLAYERYAIETSYVREVYPLKDITPLPGAPPFVMGIVNVRGRILSVVDLKKFFDLPEKGLGELNKIIILAADEMEFGILADEIVGTGLLHPDDLQPALPTFSGIGEEYLKGLAEGGLIVLDGGMILADRRIIVNEEA